MKLRILKISDKEELYKLAIEEDKDMIKFESAPIYKVKFSREMFEKMFKNNFKKDHFNLGIEEDNKIIALLSGYIKKAPGGDLGYIDNMFVKKEFRGKGYANVLRDEFYKWLKGKKVDYCQLEVLAKNEKAVSIYKKWGFGIDGHQMTTKI
jgi:ribosomal protein S18 acetylase RimI-like enzyme